MIAARRADVTRAVVLVTTIVALAGSWTGVAAQEGPQGERAGSATVVVPGGGPLEEGASSTPFTLRLPEGAACPGDSAEDDFRLQSFIVPGGVDPGRLTYESTKPAGEGRWALYAVNSEPYVQGLTSIALGPGEPGLIEGLPAFDFVVFPPGTLAEGTNHIGIACTRFNETVRYWDTDIVLTNTPDDEPAQLTWVAVDAPTGSDSSSTWWRGAGLGVVVGAVVIGVVVVVRRRRTR